MAEYLDAKAYIVAWIDFSDNVLHQQQVQALHTWMAMQVSNQTIIPQKSFHLITSVENLEQEALDRGGMLSVIEVEE